MVYIFALLLVVLSGCATAMSLPPLPPTPNLPAVQALKDTEKVGSTTITCPKDWVCLDQNNLKALLQREYTLQADDVKVRKQYEDATNAHR